jgi:phage shock protein A
METDNLILAQLSAIRNDIVTLKVDVNNKLDMLITRVSSLEGQTAQLHKSMASIHEDLAGVNLRLDNLDGRLERIEQRLDLANVLS